MKVLFLIFSVSFSVIMFNTSFADDDFFSGKIMWDEANFHNLMDSFAKKIQVIDHDMNQNSTMIEKISVQIWSDTDQKGITVSAYEIGKDAGIFESLVYFAEKPSSGQRISVTVGDKVTAKYSDHTADGTNKIDMTDSLIVKGFERENDANFRVDDPTFDRQHFQTGETIPNIFAIQIIEGLGAGLIILFIIIFAVRRRQKK